MKNNRNWYGQWYTNGKQVRVSLKTDVKEAGMSTHQNQPVCPNCGSKSVLFREKDKTCGCRRCGHRWDADKREELDTLAIRVSDVRFFPAKKQSKK
jgi:ribosomal protein L37AE/L43A